MTTATDRQRIESVARDKIESVARDTFRYESLHPGQVEAIESVLAGHDTLAVMPTGGGNRPSIRSPRCCRRGRP